MNVFRLLAIYLKPVLPYYTEKVAKLFNETEYSWKDLETVLVNKPINEYEHLATRIEPAKVTAMIDEGKKLNEEIQAQKLASSTAPKAAPKKEENRSTEKPAEIEFTDFEKVDLRIGQIIEAEEIKEADKLLKLKVDIGNGEIRQIIAGIKAAYSPEKLLNRKVLVCVNLKPRKMKFGMSEGMVLAAGEGGSDLFVLAADEGAKVGQRVK